MTMMREFLDALGLPIDGWADESPGDPAARERSKAIRLTKRLQEIRSAMIRRKLIIERLRRNLGREKSADAQIRDRIERHEARYQELFGFYAVTQERVNTARSVRG
jgi:hypothetical protein